MLESLGDTISFGAGLALLFLAFLAMRAYGPSSWTGQNGSGYLARAIFIGFAFAAGNTLYWQVFGQPAVYLGLVTVAQLRAWGDLADLLFKGGGAVAAYLHLKALHCSIPANERRLWGVLEIAFYPQRRAFLRLLTRALGNAKSE